MRITQAKLPLEKGIRTLIVKSRLDERIRTSRAKRALKRNQDLEERAPQIWSEYLRARGTSRRGSGSREEKDFEVNSTNGRIRTSRARDTSKRKSGPR